LPISAGPAEHVPGSPVRNRAFGCPTGVSAPKEDMHVERKTIARSLGVAGLVAGSFLAGMLLFSGGGSRSAGSSAAPGVDAPAGNAIVTPTVTSTDGAPGIETPEAGGATGDTTMTGTLTAVAQEPAPQTEAVAEEQAPQQLEESQPQAPQPEP